MPTRIEKPLGQTVKISMAFKDANAAYADPSTITLSIGELKRNNRIEDVATYTYAGGDITRESAGRYVYYFTPAEAGYYLGRVTATGAPQSAATYDFEIVILASAFA